MISNYSNVENFLIFFQQNLVNEADKASIENSTIWYTLYSKFAKFNDFEKKYVFIEETI